MSQTYPILSQEAIEYLCSLIKITLDSTSVLDDLNIRTDGTFSSHKIDNLLKLAIQDANEYSDSVTSALVKLTAEEMKEEPTLENTTDKINTLIVYSPTGDTNYNQYLRIQDKLIDFGSATIDFSTIYTKEQADNKFALKTDIDDIKTAIGDMITLETVEKTNIVGAINEVSNKANDIANKSTFTTLTTAQHTQLVTNGSIILDGKTIIYNENDYYIISDDTDTIDINKFNTKTFTTLSQLGLTHPITVGEIFNALPDKSILILNCDDVTKSVTDVPVSFGILIIDKNNNGRFSIEYKRSLSSSLATNDIWIGQLKGDDGTGLVWEKLITSKDLEWTVEEIDLPSKTTSLESNNITVSSIKNKREVRLYDSVNETWTPIVSNIDIGNTNRIIHTNGLGVGDAYSHSQKIQVNFTDGVIYNITTRDITNNVPNFTKIAYR